MPGLIKPGAKCPRCGCDLVAITDTTSTAQVERWYYHAAGTGGLYPGQRKRRCVFIFNDHDEAHAERYALEVHK